MKSWLNKAILTTLAMFLIGFAAVPANASTHPRVRHVRHHAAHHRTARHHGHKAPKRHHSRHHHGV